MSNPSDGAENKDPQGSPNPEPQGDQKPADEGGDQAPAKIKVGDKELTAEEIQQVLADNAKKEEQLKSLQADYTKKAQKLSELEKSQLKDKMEDINAGDLDVSNLTQDDIENLKYMEKLGVVKKADIKQLEDTLKSALNDVAEWKKAKETEAKEQRLKEIDAEVEGLKKQYQFIDKKELAEFMAEKGLGPTEAARLLYFDKFLAAGTKPSELPSFDGGSKTNEPDPEPQILDLNSREMNEVMRQKLFQKAD